jgi:hypothetical protein
MGVKNHTKKIAQDHMRSSLVTLLAIVSLTIVSLTVSAESLDYKRIHLIEYNATSTNWLFRGNMPILNGSMAYTNLTAFLQMRAKEAGLAFPTDFLLHDLSLNTIFDDGYAAEHKWWQQAENKDKGSMTTWTLGTAGLLPPSTYSEAKRKTMSQPSSSDSVWKIDEIPKRVVLMRTMLATKGAKPIVIYVHCEAGCDRTGELAGAYAMLYNAPHVTPTPLPVEVYAQDHCSAGRYPNYFSTSALQWYCYYLKYAPTIARNYSDDQCTLHADCKLFKDCHPKNATLTSST